MRRYVGRWQLFSLVYLFVFTIIFSVIQPCEAAKNPRIQGVVRDSDGDPVIGAEVTLTPTALIRNPNVTRTNKKGKYGFKNLELGTYDVSLSEDCYANGAQQLKQVELTSLSPRGTANFKLTELTNQGILAGMVKDKVTKKPLENAKVRVSIFSIAGTTTDNRGIFRFEQQCLTSGTRYAVEAIKDGYNAEQKRITAGEGENKLLFKLTPVRTTTSSTTTTIAGTTTTTVPTTTTTSSTSTTTTTTTRTTTSSSTTRTTTTTTRTTTTTIPVADFTGSWDINGSLTACISGFGCDTESFTECAQATENGDFIEDGIKTGSWVKTGAATARVDFNKALMETEVETLCEEDPEIPSCDATVSTATGSVTLVNSNQVNGTISVGGRVTFSGLGTFNFTVTGTFTGTRTASCPAVSALRDSSNQMFMNLVRQIVSMIK